MIKLNGNKIFKITLSISIFLIVLLIIYTIFSIIKRSQISNNENLEKEVQIYEIKSYDYTNFLKNSFENIDDYVGMKIKFVGYIYRMPTFTDEQFVLGRTMILDSNNSAVVVGILSEFSQAKDYKDNEWVTITGTIKRGDYMGEMPILSVEEINKCNPPEDEYVYPPTLEEAS